MERKTTRKMLREICHRTREVAREFPRKTNKRYSRVFCYIFPDPISDRFSVHTCRAGFRFSVRISAMRCWGNRAAESPSTPALCSAAGPAAWPQSSRPPGLKAAGPRLASLPWGFGSTFKYTASPGDCQHHPSSQPANTKPAQQTVNLAIPNAFQAASVEAANFPEEPTAALTMNLN